MLDRRRSGWVCPDWILWLYIRGQALQEASATEQGQDLIEYALVVSLIALAAGAGMRGVALAISTGFSRIASKLTTYTSRWQNPVGPHSWSQKRYPMPPQAS